MSPFNEMRQKKGPFSKEFMFSPKMHHFLFNFDFISYLKITQKNNCIRISVQVIHVFGPQFNKPTFVIINIEKR